MKKQLCPCTGERSRRHTGLWIALGVVLMSGPASWAQSPQYHSNDLTPPTSNGGKLMGAAGGKQVGGGSYGNHAYLLTGNALSATDLNPAGSFSSMATSISSDGSQQCGYSYFPTGSLHSTSWSGSAASAVDLHPSSYIFSYCLGADNGQQVGFAENQSYFITASHAMLWSGSAASAVDLHPVGFYPFSRSLGIRSGEQVGYISSIAYPYGDYSGYQSGTHAMRWAGTAASAVDLHPAGFDGSEAIATNGLQQGGWGYIALGASHLHALLWSGTPESAVDLHPGAYTDTRINALTATTQVGEGWVGIPGAAGSVRHALVWSGTADSVIDLNQFLPSGYTHAVATGVDADGNVVGYAYNSNTTGLFPPADAIAVVFAPGQASLAALASITLSATNAAPGAVLNGTVTLGAAAPVGGVNITFLSTNLALAATPAAVTIPEGQASATFVLPVLGSALSVPTTAKLFATDGTVSKVTPLTVTPVVNLSSLTLNPVEGGFNTYGTINLSIPAQTGGAVVTLTSGNPNLVTVPASITVPQGAGSASLTVNTQSVTTATSVPVTASFNGTTVTSTVSLSPAPVVSVANVILPLIVGGQSFTGTVTLTNFPRNAAGATVLLTSGNPGVVQVPTAVTVTQGAMSASFTASTTAVSGITSVSVRASLDGSNATGTMQVNPVPTVTIISADYTPSTQLFKVSASTTYANSVMTYGTNPNSPPVGTMQFELGAWTGSTLMATAPAFATVWNSNGGQATVPVVIKGSTGGGGGGGGGGVGGGGGSSTFKLAVGKTGKGTVTSNPAAASYPAGTVVTLTAVPDPGQPWIGWSGACAGSSKICTVTMNANLSVTANFK